MEKLKEFGEAISDRLKNPFLLTFFVIWSIKHWRLIVILFNFPENHTSSEITSDIETYLNSRGWQYMILDPFLYTIASTLVFYVLSGFFKMAKVYYFRYVSELYNTAEEGRKLKSIEEFRILEIQLSDAEGRIISLQRENKDLMDHKNISDRNAEDSLKTAVKAAEERNNIRLEKKLAEDDSHRLRVGIDKLKNELDEAWGKAFVFKKPEHIHSPRDFYLLFYQDHWHGDLSKVVIERQICKFDGHKGFRKSEGNYFQIQEVQILQPDKIHLKIRNGNSKFSNAEMILNYKEGAFFEGDTSICFEPILQRMPFSFDFVGLNTSKDD